MTLSKKIIRDIWLVFFLAVNIYFYRSLRSTAPQNSSSNSPSLVNKSAEKLQKDLQKTVELIEKLSLYTEDCDQQYQIEDFYKEVLELQKEYSQMSPILVFLGPIGAAARVLKENVIHKKLAKLVQIITQYLDKNENLSTKIGQEFFIT